MARKYSILAGSKELCSEKISGIFIGNLVGPIIHCSPDLTRVRIVSNYGEKQHKNNILNGGKKNEM